MVWKASSFGHITSWSFSPGRMPIILTGRSGAMAFARSIILMDGILGTKSSPPFMRVKFFRTKSTASLRRSQNLVMSLWVTGISFAPRSMRPRKNGTTLPREPMTLPYLTTENLVTPDPVMLFPATKSLSEQSFVAP